MRRKLRRRMRGDAHWPTSVAVAHPDIAAEDECQMVLGHGRLSQQARLGRVGCADGRALTQKEECRETNGEFAQLHDTPKGFDTKNHWNSGRDISTGAGRYRSPQGVGRTPR